MGHEQRVVAIRAFLHTIWLRRVDLYASHFASSTHLYDCTNATMTCTSKSAHYSSSTYVCQTKMGHEQRVVAIRAFLHTIWLRRVYLNSSSFDSSRHLFDCHDSTTMINSCRAPQMLSTYIYQTKMRHVWRIGTMMELLLKILLRREDLLTASCSQIKYSYISYQCPHLNLSLYIIHMDA